MGMLFGFLSDIAFFLFEIQFGRTNTQNLKALFRKAKLLKRNKKNTQLLSQKIEVLSTSLQQSSLLMTEIEAELAKQKLRAEKWTEEAETSKIIAEMNEKELEAARKILGGEVKAESKRSGRSAWLWSAFFCIIGIIGGFLLSHFFG